MKPTSQEIKCLLISKEIRERRIKEVIAEIENKTEPYLVLPVQMFGIRSYKQEFFGLKVYKKVLALTVFHLLYVILYIPRLLLIPYSNWDYRKKLPAIISEIWLRTDENFNVTEKKLFSLLWRESGLYTMNMWRSYELKFTDEEALLCMKEWVKILYHKEIDIMSLYDRVKKEINNSKAETRQNNPSMRYTFVRPIIQVPEEIDKIFGEYKILV